MNATELAVETSEIKTNGIVVFEPKRKSIV